MFYVVVGSYNSYVVGAMTLATWRTTPSCVTMRGGGGTCSTGAAGVFVSAPAAGALVGSVTMGWDSATGVGAGAGMVSAGVGAGAGAVSAGGVTLAVATAGASCFKYIAATKA